MIIISLLLAHLIADFFLQPTELIKWKLQDFKGVLFHVLIFALVSLAILFPYLIYKETWLVIGLIAIAHFLIDKLKIYLERKYKLFPYSFFIDQLLHLITLIIGGLFLGYLIPKLPDFWLGFEVVPQISIWMILFAAIYIGYILDILFVQNKNVSKHVSMKHDLAFLYTKTATKIGFFTMVFLIYLLAAVIFLMV